MHSAFARLAADFGKLIAPVDVQLTVDGSQVSAAPVRHEMAVAEAVELIKTDDKGSLHYIKDWHLFLQLERSGIDGQEPLYIPPSIFRDDWMNHPTLIQGGPRQNAAQQKRDDFRFCYAGQAGTATGLHADVYTSYSWSTNIVGVKRWRMFPPDVAFCLRRYPPPAQGTSEEQIQRARTSELGSSVAALDDIHADASTAQKPFPRWPEARERMIEFIQPEGTTVFVPSNWYHEVRNETDCISINHNWCNSVNLPSMYEAMKDEVIDVEQSLSDVQEMIRDAWKQQHGNEKTDGWRDEWVETVQRVVEQDMGWAWAGFWEMVEINLREPACPQALRPSGRVFLRPRLRQVVDDFLARDDVTQLPEVRAAAQRCRSMLDGMP